MDGPLLLVRRQQNNNDIYGLRSRPNTGTSILAFPSSGPWTVSNRKRKRGNHVRMENSVDIVSDVFRSSVKEDFPPLTNPVRHVQK